MRIVFGLVLGCFFLSGVAGLVYQVVWSRYLALFLGHTSYAVVAVLVAFMGGLAAGNALVGPIADRVSKPLALYAWLELGIAAYALIFPAYYDFVHDGYLSCARRIASSGGAPLLALKFLFSFVTIVLPATLMGATFPALTRFVTKSLAELREKVASLYFINSFGAVVGCVVADFWWIPKYGLEMTIFGAGGLNLLAALAGFGMSRAILEGAEPNAVQLPADPNGSEESFSESDLKMATWAIGASGFVAMLYEVAWTRLLALALGSSTHAFSIMLITFIGGIAVGSALIARWKSLKRTMDAFGWAELGLAMAVFLSMFTYEFLPYWFSKSANYIARTPEAYPFYEIAQAFVCLFVMFIPAVFLGTTLPLASRIATAEVTRTGRSIGRVFAVNTIGTVFGAAVTGLFLMKQFGLAGTFALGVAINAVIGAAILWREGFVHARTRMLTGAVVTTCVLVWGASVYFGPLWRGSFGQGFWRYSRTGGKAASLAEYRKNGEKLHFLYYVDGASSTIALHSYADRPTNHKSLRTNGKVDASSADLGTQLILGHLPALMHTKATNTLVVGLGSGMTASALLRHTNILSVQAVELSAEVTEAYKYFADFNDRVFENPRFHLAIEDAKSFLQISDQKYDIIVSEPSNPWMAGVASVFSVEFFQSCAARLTQNGVMVQWVHIYETSDATLQSVIKTFSSVFPFVSLWRSQEGDIVLVGAPQLRAIDLNAFIARMNDPRVAADLARGGFSEPLALLSREIVSSQNGAFLARPASIVHSDFFPTLEYMAQVGFFVAQTSTFYNEYDETRTTRAETLLASYLKKHPMAGDDFGRVAQAILDKQFTSERGAYSLAQRWALVETNNTLPLEMLDRLHAARPPEIADELRLLPKHAWLLEQARTDVGALYFYERTLLRAYRAKRSVFFRPETKELEETLAFLIKNDAANRRLWHLHLSELAWDRGDDAEALRYGALGLNRDVKQFGPMNFTMDEQAPRQVLCNLIDSSLRTANLPRALELAGIAKNAGYLRPGELFFPPLELVCFKARSIAESAPSKAP